MTFDSHPHRRLRQHGRGHAPGLARRRARSRAVHRGRSRRARAARRRAARSTRCRRTRRSTRSCSGVKPQLLAEVAPQVAPLAGAGTTLFSILAGVELAVLDGAFPAGRRDRAADAEPLGRARQVADRARLARARPARAGRGDRAARPARHARMDRRGRRSTSSPRSPARARRSSIASSTRWRRPRPSSACPREQAARLALATVDGAAALAAASPHDPGRARAPRRQPRRGDAGRARRARRRRRAAQR